MSDVGPDLLNLFLAGHLLELTHQLIQLNLEALHLHLNRPHIITPLHGHVKKLVQLGLQRIQLRLQLFSGLVRVRQLILQCLQLVLHVR